MNEVYATLLDQGIYHCSIRTMYRMLHEHDELKERRRQLRHPVYQKPELIAEGSRLPSFFLPRRLASIRADSLPNPGISWMIWRHAKGSI